MTNLNFRKLRAEEIEVRVQSVTDKGAVLLLYKDSRTDMNILDETVGPMNWKREHTRDNANCIVSIWCDKKNMWVSKEDTGTESNTEKEKGLASDSFKRACFNWGIGRELYTSPFIFVKAGDVNINNKKCYDKFSVSTINYDEQGNIVELKIVNLNNKKVCFSYGGSKPQQQQKQQNNQQQQQEPTKPRIINGDEQSKLFVLATGKDTSKISSIIRKYGFDKSSKITVDKFELICKEIEAL